MTGLLVLDQEIGGRHIQREGYPCEEVDRHSAAAKLGQAEIVCGYVRPDGKLILRKAGRCSSLPDVRAHYSAPGFFLGLQSCQLDLRQRFGRRYTAGGHSDVADPLGGWPPYIPGPHPCNGPLNDGRFALRFR
jgi:hypothetical protein